MNLNILKALTALSLVSFSSVNCANEDVSEKTIVCKATALKSKIASYVSRKLTLNNAWTVAKKGIALAYVLVSIKFLKAAYDVAVAEQNQIKNN